MPYTCHQALWFGDFGLVTRTSGGLPGQVAVRYERSRAVAVRTGVTARRAPVGVRAPTTSHTGRRWTFGRWTGYLHHRAVWRRGQPSRVAVIKTVSKVMTNEPP